MLIADDSPALRGALRSLLALEPDLEVVGEAGDGLEAVELAQKLTPDVITMDVAMPHLDGLGATSQIMARAPSRIVVVSAVSEARLVDLSYRAMAAGALELVAKPEPGADLRQWSRKVAESVRLMAEIPVVTRRPGPQAAPRPRLGKAGTVDALGLVASTGGPAALVSILEQLPAHFPAPLLVAQHTAPGFTSGLVRWFSGATPLEVQIARGGTMAAPGCVYLPPDGFDLLVDGEGVLQLARNRTTIQPSGDRLLESMARAWGPRAGGVVLTGMGQDGAQGLLAIRKAGGATLAQDKESSVVFGMPRAALELGAAEQALPLSAIPSALRSLCERRN